MVRWFVRGWTTKNIRDWDAMAAPKGMDLSAEFVARAVGLLGLKSTSQAWPSKTTFSEVGTDSRVIKPGHLFIPLKGETFDGHAFIEDAVKRGAKGFFCQASPEVSVKESLVQFQVADTLAAFKKLAGAWRDQFDIPLAMIAGSVGKTSAKDMLAAILSGKFTKTLKTEGSQNGHVGIPSTLLRLRSTHEAAVIEVGIDEPGVMSKHVALVRPKFALLTAIAPEHLETLGSMETVAAEEMKALSDTLALGGRAVFNLDDEVMKTHFNSLKSDQKFGFTLHPQFKPRADIFVARLSVDGTSVELTWEFEGQKFTREKFLLPLPGRHNASNLVGALSVAILAGLSPDEMRKGLKNFKGSGGRSEIQRHPSGAVFICDWYNASPASMNAAMDLLKEQYHQLKRRGSRIACLGDMLELGKEEEVWHRKLAEKIAATQLDYVLLYGERMKWLRDELSRRRFDTIVHHHESHADLVTTLRRILRPDDVILIKGSRGMKMDQVWEILVGPTA